jgi:hypothetical protein
MSAAMVILPVIWATEAVGEPAVVTRKQKVHARQQRVLAPEVAFYRKYSEGMLRRYVRLSLEAGRAPSFLGRDMFRGRVTNYTVHGFDDVVIFVHDVEQCIAALEEGDQYLIRRIALQEYTQGETAKMLGLTLRTLGRRYNESLDRLTRLFLDRGLLVLDRARQQR